MNLIIRHPCPQCGAPINLDETDHLIRCDFCRVRSYLLPQLFYRYMLPNRAPRDRALTYVPYWRFKGMTFSCTAGGIVSRFVDASRHAVDTDALPASLGLRTQAMHLFFSTAESPGRFLRPVVSYASVMSLFGPQMHADETAPSFYSTQIGESISLIYAPFYTDRAVYDAVLNTPVSTPADFRLDAFAGGTPDWRIRFLATLCPNCGWDMEGNRDSMALFCRNCNRIWAAGAKTFQPVDFAMLPSDGKALRYLPFWCIGARVTGVALDSYADFARLANLPRVARDDWQERPFRFWAPAFKVQPRSFLALANAINLAQPRGKARREIPRGAVHPVTLAAAEAVETLKLTLANLMKPARQYLPKLPDIDIVPRGFRLVFIPFSEGPMEFINEDFGLVVNKNQVALASNL